MINLSAHSMQLAVDSGRVPDWAREVVVFGRDSAYVDTSYLQAWLDDKDNFHKPVLKHHESSKARMYTSSLVLAELSNHFVKNKTREFGWKVERAKFTRQLIIDDRVIFVCSPDRDTILTAIREFEATQTVLGATCPDLCDIVSIVILNCLRHKRVFGLDNHFRLFGAAVEPF